MFCTGKRGVGRYGKRLFYLLRNERASPAPPPALPICPSGGDPSLQRTRADYTAQAAGQAVPDAKQTTRSRMHTDTHTRTLDTLHRSAPDTKQAAPGRLGRRRAWGWSVRRHNACMLHTQRFYVLVRLILNILLTCTFNHV